MTSPRVGAPSSSIHTVEIEADVAAYDPTAERVAVLNKTASAIWRLCDGNRTVDEMAEALSLEFGIESHIIREEIASTIIQLTSAGFLDPVAPKEKSASSPRR